MSWLLFMILLWWKLSLTNFKVLLKTFVIEKGEKDKNTIFQVKHIAIVLMSMLLTHIIFNRPCHNFTRSDIAIEFLS